ncbi:conserved hypothetical protein [Rhodobacteraceae bacterium KLH11]|nr:conserved hypothetical protein [Rhodobacteraceae bacterium KLH11]
MKNCTDYLIGVTLAWNDADVIEATLRNNLQVFDLIVVVIRPSTDGTEAVVEALSAEGLAIIPWKLPVSELEDVQIMSSIYLRVQDFLDNPAIAVFDACDVFIVRDQDTFLNDIRQVPEGARGNIRRKIALPPSSGIETSAVDLSEFTGLLDGPGGTGIALKPKGVATSHAQPIKDKMQNLVDVDGTSLADCTIDSAYVVHIPVRSAEQLYSKAATISAMRALSSGKVGADHDGEMFKDILKSAGQGKAVNLSALAAKFHCPEGGRDHSEGVEVGATPITLPRQKLQYAHLIKPEPPRTKVVDRLVRYLVPKVGPINKLVRRAQEPMSHGEELPKGTFSPAQHISQLMCDWPPIEYLCNASGANSVQDIGCGLAAYLQLMKSERGCRVKGIDGSKWSDLHFVDETDYETVDLSNTPDTLIGEYDMVMCLEVVEHLPEASAKRLVEQIANCNASVVLFSAAQPGQHGSGHICLKDASEWLSIYRDAGWQVDTKLTIGARFLSSLHWFRKNIYVLKRNPDSSPNPSLQHLLNIGKQPLPWPYTPETTIIDYPGKVRVYGVDDSASERAVFEKVETVPFGHMSLPRTSDADRTQLEELERENSRLSKELERAEKYPWKLFRKSFQRRAKSQSR